ncbi:MAG: hypothetical protein JRI23_00420, partial [Deltaproteobacteria bacterium]|nr:hypothetical protein [Deltaproteobacteria bacterium]MBW2529906.1 hypothetical protein [Deltaproteobacteria bacterium]
VEDYERLVAQELVWVKGATDTTYVVGEGIGPDLTMPVPYAMVRRSGQDASFHVLHVPHGTDGPPVGSFDVAPADSPDDDRAMGYRIAGTTAEGEAFDDALMIVGRGAGSTERTFGDHGTDGTLAWARHRDDGTLARLTLADGTFVADSSQDLYRAPGAMVHVAFALAAGAVEILVAETDVADSRLLAPATTSVTYEGAPVTFTQDGDYIVFGSIATPGAGASSTEDDSGCDCSTPRPTRLSPPWWLTLVGLAWLRRRREKGTVVTDGSICLPTRRNHVTPRIRAGGGRHPAISAPCGVVWTVGHHRPLVTKS